MTKSKHALYRGTVVHKRVTPVEHALRYNVFSCLFDCRRLSELDHNLRFFSRNRFNLISLFDSDHTDGEDIESHLQDLAQRNGYADCADHFIMLTYPRVLGYVFNPLTVFFGFDRNDKLSLVIYEVSNTYGGRHRYILPVTNSNDDVIVQECDKSFYVSPFNKVEGRYLFHVTPPEDTLTVGVALTTEDGPLLKTHFRGTREPLTDKTLLQAVLRTGWLTVKVILAIHYEALKLWLKGLRFKPMPKETTTN